MIRALFKLLFAIAGWKVVGGIPDGVKKAVIIVAPHTSMWDFYYGVATRSIQNFKANFLAKEELFKNPVLGWFLRMVGGIPVMRGVRKNPAVESAVQYFNERESLFLALAPEGTRSKVKEWKTGFLRIAHAAQVPVLVVKFDYGNKEVKWIDAFYTTGDVEADLKAIKNMYGTVTGKHHTIELS